LMIELGVKRIVSIDLAYMESSQLDRSGSRRAAG
jgi:hypothetical protein